MDKKLKAEFLQSYINKKFRKIAKSHPENIVGCTIGNKIAGGKIKKNTSFIFQVVDKIAEDTLNKKQIIPESLNVKMPDGSIETIVTDVIKTGAFRLQSGIGNEVTSKLSNQGTFGTSGLFVTDDRVRSLMITNFHVVAEKLLQNGKTYYRRPPSNVSTNIRIRNPAGAYMPGRLDVGGLNSRVDVAFVEIPDPPSHKMNRLSNGIQVQGKVGLAPIPGNFKGRGVYVFCYSSPVKQAAVITNVSASVHDGNVHFEGLLQFTKCTIPGDSGSLVVTTNYAAIGIVIGADDEFSYAVPFHEIEKFKSFFIL